MGGRQKEGSRKETEKKVKGPGKRIARRERECAHARACVCV